MANPVLSFAGGPVPQPTPTIPQLRENAFDWIALASLHESAALDAAEAGDFDTAYEQLQIAETKLSTARVRYAEARKLLRSIGQ